jgi:hypothetical protein
MNNQELPGMEERGLPEIEQAAERYRMVRDARCAFSRQEAEAKGALIQVMINTGRTFYSYKGLVVQLSRTENVKVKAKDEEEDDKPVGKARQHTLGELRQHTPSEARLVKATPIEEALDQVAEDQRRFVAEILPDTCTCGHTKAGHAANGACEVVDEADEVCMCDGFTPATEHELARQEALELELARVVDQERERLNQEAVARWAGEADPADGEIVVDGDWLEDGGTPIATDFDHERINRFAGYCAADRISKEEPVKICYVDDAPFVITSATGVGDNWEAVEAFSILPIENVGQENTKTYSQALEERRDVGNRFKTGALSYEGLRINCGSRKKPAWWAIVGPKLTFTVKPAADQDDDDEPQPIGDPKLYASLDQAPRPYSIQDDIGEGPAGTYSPDPSILCWCKHKYADHREGTFCKKKNCGCSAFSYQDAAKPQADGPDQADDFTAPRCEECKAIDGGHTAECSSSSTLSFDDYLRYSQAHYGRNHKSYARKLELSRDHDDQVRAWLAQNPPEESEAE